MTENRLLLPETFQLEIDKELKKLPPGHKNAWIGIVDGDNKAVRGIVARKWEEKDGDVWVLSGEVEKEYHGDLKFQIKGIKSW